MCIGQATAAYKMSVRPTASHARLDIDSANGGDNFCKECEMRGGRLFLMGFLCLAVVAAFVPLTTQSARACHPAPRLSINDVIVDPEGDSGTTPAVFAVSLSWPVCWWVAVEYETADGSAIAGADYQAASGTVVFRPGETTELVLVDVIGDTLVEPDEYFFVNLSEPSNACIGDGQGEGTIVDDDEPPVLSIDDVTVDPEGDSGTTPAVFTVSLSQPSGEEVVVSYTTVGGTAIAGADYQSTSGTLTFAPGEVSQPVTVPVIGDTLIEPDEYFYVDLSNSSNACIGDGQGKGTIVDDDSTEAIPGMTTWGAIASAMLLAAVAVAMMRRKYARLTA